MIVYVLQGIFIWGKYLPRNARGWNARFNFPTELFILFISWWMQHHRFRAIYLHKEWNLNSYLLATGLTSEMKIKYKQLLKFICEGGGKFAVFSAKGRDHRNRAGLIESATPCHDAQMVGPYRGSNPLHLTVLTSKSEDYTTAPQQASKQYLFVNAG